MANPNRAMANIAKNPFTHVEQTRDFAAANRKASEVSAAGFEVKVTTKRMGKHPKGWKVFNVWKRDK